MENYTFDLQRIFLGNLPPLIFLEIVLRTVLMYSFSLACLRILGKRSTRELTPVDVILIVALGSAVGDPMFSPDVPLLHGMLVVGLVIGLQRLAVMLANDHARIEKGIKGSPVRLVAEGVLDLKARKQAEFSRDEIFAMLREHGYTNLGQVARMYLETDGSVTHYPFPDDRAVAGLPVTPPWELEPPNEIKAGERLTESTQLGCSYCGHVIPAEQGKTVPRCPRCHRTDWVIASEAEQEDPTGQAPDTRG